MMGEILRVINSLPPGWDALRTSIPVEVTRLNGERKLVTKEDIAALLLELKPAFEEAAKVK